MDVAEGGDRRDAIALPLGTLASFAVARYRFFGRETISFLVILPIALPGIVTGMALNATFREVLSPLGIGLGLFTVIVGHATFCIVVVFNNVIARLRRTSGSFEEASADLGATRGRRSGYVTFPALRSAMVAGALLAFALSFDEVIVTTFTAGQQQTLPIWILANLSRPEPAADRQRRRRADDPALDGPGLPRAPAHGRPARATRWRPAGRRRRRGALGAP